MVLALPPGPDVSSTPSSSFPARIKLTRDHLGLAAFPVNAVPAGITFLMNFAVLKRLIAPCVFSSHHLKRDPAPAIKTDLRRPTPSMEITWPLMSFEAIWCFFRIGIANQGFRRQAWYPIAASATAPVADSAIHTSLAKSIFGGVAGI